MAGVASKFVSTAYTKYFLKPFKAIKKSIHVPSGKAEAGGAVKKPKARPTEGASFRKAGSVPEDKSGFKVQHLGDKKK